jgi:hypothetical protein
MIDFLKKNSILALEKPKRNLMGDLVIGWNRKARDHTESVTLEKANEWLLQDIEKARKAVNKQCGLGDNDVLVFILFYVGTRRFKDFNEFLNQFNEVTCTRDLSKIALSLTNHRYFKNNPMLASLLAKKILQKETKLV